MAAKYVILVTAKLVTNTNEAIARIKRAILHEDSTSAMEFVVVPLPEKD